MLYLMCWDILVKLKLRRVIDMTIDEALKVVISLGVVQPEKFSDVKVKH